MLNSCDSIFGCHSDKMNTVLWGCFCLFLFFVSGFRPACKKDNQSTVSKLYFVVHKFNFSLLLKKVYYSSVNKFAEMDLSKYVIYTIEISANVRKTYILQNQILRGVI